MWIPDRQEALDLLRHYIKNENLVKHCVATEAIMRSLAARFGADEQLWGITGLLHDLDLELLDNKLDNHARETVRILEGKGFPKEGLDAILTHNDTLGVPCTETFHWALSAAETITGLVVACTLVYPSRKIADVRPKSIRKRMKEKRFAANVDRDRILFCEEIGIELNEFILLSLEAMKGAAVELGLV
jgi:uncharacterized protein